LNFYHTSLLDAVALKFLSVKPYSIYQLQKSIVERIGEVVKTNAVSYCLRRLAKKGYASMRTQAKGKVQRRIYSITQAGRKQLAYYSVTFQKLTQLFFSIKTTGSES
jgi:DNA-binding PadR family transcriptional regulator